MTDESTSDDAQPDAPDGKKKRKRYPPRNFTTNKMCRQPTDEEAAEREHNAEKVLQEIAEGHRKAKRRHRKLSAQQADQIMAAMRLQLLDGSMPRAIVNAMCVEFRISMYESNKLMDFVRRDAMRLTGYYRVQVQEIAQRILIEACTSKEASITDKLRAVSELNRMFDLHVPPEDHEESERSAVDGLLRRISTFDESELASLQEQIEKGDVSIEELYDPQNAARMEARKRQRKQQFNARKKGARK